MNTEHFNHVPDMDQLPAGSTIQYPRTPDDEIAEIASQLHDEANVVGLARHEPHAEVKKFGVDDSRKVNVRTPHTEADDMAAMMTDLVSEERWTAFMENGSHPKRRR